MSQLLALATLAAALGFAPACGSGHADASDAGGTAGATDGATDADGGTSDVDSILACDDRMKGLDLGPGATITLVKFFKSGAALSFTSPPAVDTPTTIVDLCLVKVIVGPGNPGPADAPSTSPGIGLEIWLPTRANWNERYEAFGSGGFAGGPDITSLVAIGSLARPGDQGAAVTAGFVVSITDGGHAIQTGSFGMNPDGSFNTTLFKDFAERASHEMALKTKALIKAFYGKEAKYNYWNGCSEGGREGIMEAQRHPEDFDGILVGAPALNFDRLTVSHLWPQIVMQQDLGGPMATAKLAAATAAANAACGGALTGQADGYITDPSACRYDPSTDNTLLCASAGGTNATASCLTKVEAIAVNKIWYGPTSDGTVPTPSTEIGRAPLGTLAPNQLWFGPERGTLLAGHFIWDGLAGQLPFPIATDVVALALGDASFALPGFVNATGNGQNKWRSIGYTGTTSFPEVFAASRERLGAIIATANPDLSGFAARGGKLLMWHGTADSLISPHTSINYYEAVATKAGGYEAAQKVARFYLGPGIDHCFHAGVPGTHPTAPGGQVEGPSVVLIDVLEKWLENGEAPDQLTATSAPDVAPVQTRPWCLYPKKLKYVSGDAGAGTFTCE